MKKTNLITSVVLVILIFIFIIWSFNLKEPLEEGDVRQGLNYLFFEVKQEVQRIWQDFKRELNNLNKEKATKILDKEELNRLKKKILEHEKETEKK